MPSLLQLIRNFVHSVYCDSILDKQEVTRTGFEPVLPP
jgi:hypothetical protein